MIYFLGWLLNYWSFSIWALFPKKALLLFPFLFVGPLIFFRYSGTDVELYELILQSLVRSDDNTLTRGIEPGFTLLSKTFLWLTGSEVWALRWIGAVYVFLLCIYVLRANRTEAIFFALYFFPAFVYQYGMNVVRAGLGMAVFLLAWQAFRKKQGTWGFILSLISLLFHYSMIVPILLLYSNFVSTRKKMLFFGFLGLAVPVLVFFRWEYLESKFFLYSSFDSPSELSGLSRLLILAVLWLSFAMTKVPLRVKLVNLLVLIGLSLGFQILALYSYAGLRLLDLMAFITPLIMVGVLEREQGRVGKVFLLGLALAGLLGAGLLYRNFLTDFEGQLTGTSTPFLPYRTIFEEWR